MGQTRDVLVYRLLCENTIEERMSEILDEKQKIFNEFADKSVAAQNSIIITKEKFGALIKGEAARIKKEKGIVDVSTMRATTQTVR